MDRDVGADRVVAGRIGKRLRHHRRGPHIVCDLIRPPQTFLAGSFSEHKFDLVRAGLMLYGSSPVPSEQRFLQPVMALKSRVALLCDLPAGRSLSYGRTFTTSQAMRVATITIAGYADGYRRSLSNREAAVLIGGRRCPGLGRVTMDLTMVDVSPVPGVKPGDEVVLIGKQGSEEILVAEVAERAGTVALGDFYRYWQPGAAGVSLIRALRFEIR